MSDDMDTVPSVKKCSSQLEKISLNDPKGCLADPPEVHLMGCGMVRDVRASKGRNAITWCYPGIRVENLTTRLASILKDATDDPLVVVHVGTNNMEVDRPQIVIERLIQFSKEVQRLRPRAKILISIALPRFYRGAEGKNDTLDIAREVFFLCRRQRLSMIDASKELTLHQKRHFCADGLHLTVEGKAVLSSVLQYAIAKFIQENY